jgi:hypothetical protein
LAERIQCLIKIKNSTKCRKNSALIKANKQPVKTK